MYSSLFFAPDIPVFVQVLLQACILSLYIPLINRGLKQSRFLFVSIFYFWNLIFVIPFYLSISSGNSGYAARLVGMPATDGFVLFLYLMQILMPVFVIELIIRLFNFKNLHVNFQWKQGAFINATFFLALSAYVLAFFFFNESPLKLVLMGDIQSALDGRVSLRVGGGAGDFGFIFKFYRVISQLALIWSIFFILSNKKLSKLPIIAIFLVAAFSDFSKGGLAYGIVMLAVSQYIYFGRVREYDFNFGNTKILILGALVSVTALVVYIRVFVLDNFFLASTFILKRFYNHTSSVIGQIELFSGKAPLLWTVSDFGSMTRLMSIDPFVPKAEIYPVIFGRDGGQAGSMMSSELFFFAESVFPLVMILILTIIALSMMAFNSLIVNLDVSKRSNILFIPFAVYVSVVLPLYTLWQPFKVFSVLTFFRFEIILFLLILLVLFRFSWRKPA